MTSLKVLVVDDSTPMRKALKELLLSFSECAVIGEASNGQDGLGLARTHRPDLVIMDISMPVMGGLEALPLLKRDLPCTQVVMISTTVHPDVRARALEVGAIACLEKGPELWRGLPAIFRELSQASS